MPVFSPRPDVRPDAFGFSGAPRNKPFAGSRFRGPFSDAEEAELALELLQVTSETQFDRFLDNLFKRVWGGGIAPIGSKVSGPLRRLLKTVASKALPSVATAAPTSFGPANDAVAQNLGSLVSRALEAEVAAPTAPTAIWRSAGNCSGSTGNSCDWPGRRQLPRRRHRPGLIPSRPRRKA